MGKCLERTHNEQEQAMSDTAWTPGPCPKCTSPIDDRDEAEAWFVCGSSVFIDKPSDVHQSDRCGWIQVGVEMERERQGDLAERSGFGQYETRQAMSDGYWDKAVKREREAEQRVANQIADWIMKTPGGPHDGYKIQYANAIRNGEWRND